MSASTAPARGTGEAIPETGGTRLPRHVAIIMDGNGRWAAARGLPRVAGHRAGAQAVRRVLEAAVKFGVPWLTLYAFSSENWGRPADEVTDLMGLLRFYLRNELAALHRQGVRIRTIGATERFAPELRAELERAVVTTAHNTTLNLTVALSYGGRDEIVRAARRIAAATAAGRLDPATLDEAAFAAQLDTAGMPDPDLVIRTSGEQRVSNFLLWQVAYAEFVFPEVLWPDFSAEHLREALAAYAGRERRFGRR